MSSSAKGLRDGSPEKGNGPEVRRFTRSTAAARAVSASSVEDDRPDSRRSARRPGVVVLPTTQPESSSSHGKMPSSSATRIPLPVAKQLPVRKSLARAHLSSRSRPLKDRARTLKELATDSLNATLAAAGSEEPNDNEAEKLRDSLVSNSEASIFSRDAAPFCNPADVINSLNRSLRVSSDSGAIEDAVWSFNIAMFAWVILRPDTAGALWKSKIDKSSEIDRRNAVLLLAWSQFWAILPIDMLGDEESLQLWLEFATQIFLHYQSPSILQTPPVVEELSRSDTSSPPPPAPFDELFDCPDFVTMKPKTRKRWEHLVRTRTSDLKKNMPRTRERHAYVLFQQSMLGLVRKAFDIYTHTDSDEERPAASVTETATSPVENGRLLDRETMPEQPEAPGQLSTSDDEGSLLHVAESALEIVDFAMLAEVAAELEEDLALGRTPALPLSPATLGHQPSLSGDGVEWAIRDASQSIQLGNSRPKSSFDWTAQQPDAQQIQWDSQQDQTTRSEEEDNENDDDLVPTFSQLNPDSILFRQRFNANTDTDGHDDDDDDAVPTVSQLSPEGGSIPVAKVADNDIDDYSDEDDDIVPTASQLNPDSMGPVWVSEQQQQNDDDDDDIGEADVPTFSQLNAEVDNELGSDDQSLGRSPHDGGTMDTTAAPRHRQSQRHPVSSPAGLIHLIHQRDRSSRTRQEAEKRFATPEPEDILAVEAQPRSTPARTNPRPSGPRHPRPTNANRPTAQRSESPDVLLPYDYQDVEVGYSDDSRLEDGRLDGVKQDDEKLDRLMIDHGNVPLVEQPDHFLPPRYRPSSPNLKPGQSWPRRWTDGETYILYRTVQKVPHSEPHACRVVAYLHGERGVKTQQLRGFTVQQMRDRMRVVVDTRRRNNRPVVGRARMWLPQGHPGRIEYEHDMRRYQLQQRDQVPHEAPTQTGPQSSDYSHRDDDDLEYDDRHANKHAVTNDDMGSESDVSSGEGDWGEDRVLSLVQARGATNDTPSRPRGHRYRSNGIQRTLGQGAARQAPQDPDIGLATLDDFPPAFTVNANVERQNPPPAVQQRSPAIGRRRRSPGTPASERHVRPRRDNHDNAISDHLLSQSRSPSEEEQEAEHTSQPTPTPFAKDEEDAGGLSNEHGSALNHDSENEQSPGLEKDTANTVNTFEQAPPSSRPSKRKAGADGPRRGDRDTGKAQRRERVSRSVLGNE